MNLASLLRVNAANAGQRPALFYGDTTVSYRQLWRRVQQAAATLAQAGINRGDRVGLSMADHATHLTAHYAVALLGAVIVPIDHRWTEQEKQRAAQSFDVKLIASDQPVGELATIQLDSHRQSNELPEPVVIDQDAPLLISLSSGTTGKPKGAVVSHRQLYERFVSQWVAIGLDASDCFAVATPLYFGAGRSFAMSLLAAGGKIKLTPPPLTPTELVDALCDPRVSATFLPPTLLRRLLPLADSDQPLLPKLRYLLVSGEPLHADEAKQVRQRICPNLYGYYASSEGGGISVLRPEQFADHASTVGIATFRTEVEIVDQAGEPLAAGQVGRLRYRGPGVATQFVDADGKLERSDEAGWFYPGDLAERAQSGHITLRGRDKDVIIRGGVNIYPAEIESVLIQLAGVSEAAVLGRPDQQRGECVVAFVVADNSMTAAALEQYCRQRLAPYKVPSEFVTIEALPKRHSGKVDKQALLTGAARG